MSKAKRLSDSLKKGVLPVVLLMPGCSAGPDFVPPEPPKSDHSISRVMPIDIEAERITFGEAPRSWWEEFRSSKQNTLISVALIKSPTLEAATATLRQAEYLYKAKGGSTLYPRIEANLDAQRQGINGTMSGSG